MAESKIQWHPGFYAGMEVEFQTYQVTMEREFQLTRGPLSIDLIIIKKLTDEKIDNQIGNIFRRYNIVEYKSPDDELSIDIFYKTQAYACLYKASGDSTNEIPADEVTVTLCRDTYPKGLLKELELSGFNITERFPGVYYISGKGFFPTQIIVSGALESADHAVLRILSNHAKEEDIKDFLNQTKTFTEQGARARADAILQVSASANFALYQKIYKEEPNMCQALYEIMKDDIDSRVQQGAEKTAVSNIKSLMETMNLSATQAMNALRVPPEDQARYAAML